MTPDPPREEAGVCANDSLNIGGITDSDDDDDRIHEGYEMLPTDAEDADNISESEISDGTPELSPCDPSGNCNFDEGVAEELKVVWNRPVDAYKEEMDSRLRDEVLKAMEGFTLPSTAIPHWANEVKEEEWKKHLLDKIKEENR